MTNPVIAEITRGTEVESRHRGAYAIADSKGAILASVGDIASPIFPRSAVKAFQCLPLIETGAAKHFDLNDEEIALCCSSHNGEADHLRVARSILAKAGVSEACYECGAHMPSDKEAANALIRSGAKPLQLHNNCSGKHAGMLAFAKHIGAALEGYVKPEHPVQREIAKTMAQYFAVDMASAPMGIDGCSVPTWAIPLSNLAQGFAKLNDSRNEAAHWITKAARQHPFLIAGTDRFDTKIMQAVPRLFIKVGAEGVFCGCIPHAGLGFALKCDDGAVRGAEVAIAHALAALDVWSDDEKKVLNGFATEALHNWRKLETGMLRFSP